MTNKKKRIAFDVPADSDIAVWSTNQHDKRASYTAIVNNIINRFGEGDLFEALLANANLFNTQGSRTKRDPQALRTHRENFAVKENKEEKNEPGLNIKGLDRLSQ